MKNLLLVLAMAVSGNVMAHETNVQELMDLGMDSGFAREIAESHALKHQQLDYLGDVVVTEKNECNAFDVNPWTGEMTQNDITNCK